jgi:hypothetical protein
MSHLSTSDVLDRTPRIRLQPLARCLYHRAVAA